MGYKTQNCAGSVSSVTDAYSALEELGNECREIVDNASEGLAQTQRIQTFDETAGTLEGLSEPDVPAVVADLAISYSEQTNKRGVSRAHRCSNALNVMGAAVLALEEWLDDEANAEHEDRDEVEALKDQLDSDISDAEGCEFPGMFG